MREVIAFLLAACAAGAAYPQIGRLPEGGAVAPTLQTLRPAGTSVDVPGRPRDLVASPDGRFVYVKNLSKGSRLNLTVVDVARARVIQSLDEASDAHSFHGIAISRDGRRIYTTADQGGLHELTVAADGTVAWGRRIALEARPDKSYPGAGGVALDPAGGFAYVCVSRGNRLAVVDLQAGREVAGIPVGVAPYAVALDAAGRRAYVTNWGGRRPKAGEPTADAQGMDALVDPRGVAASGTVSVVDLAARKTVAEVATGLHPTGLALDERRGRLYVANANDDSVSIVDVARPRVLETLGVRADPRQPFGSGPNALALAPDGRTLYVCNGGNNAVAVVRLGSGRSDRPSVAGFIPTAWYPAGVALAPGKLFVANLKGWGSLDRPPGQRGFHVRDVLGTVSLVDLPDEAALADYTRRVREDAGVAQALAALERASTDARPVPVPARAGEPSVFKHVVFVIKENRTYDQVLGDLGRGNGDPSLCIFGRAITPNHHALAEEFTLLDNFFCNSLYSADGHAWITEANTTDYMEKSRSNLVWGNNPLSYSSSGFLWTHVLNHGLTFENFGEYDYTAFEPKTASYNDIYRGLRAGSLPVRFIQNIGIAALRPYSRADAPGWNMDIPDAVRVEAFLRRFREHEVAGTLPGFTILYLPNDHTSGTAQNKPTPRAYLADNDLALGRAVEAISRSRFWPETCIFVVEDDPQNGFDHVDGHRTVAYAISPYTRRGAVVSTRYNQTSMLRTMELILGLPPMTQFDAMAPPMREVFQSEPDLRPYAARPVTVPLDELNPPRRALRGQALHWAKKSEEQRLERVDEAEEDEMNRILWHAMKGVDARYPAEFTSDGKKKTR
jgi:YVTN family beta-propeller protein